MSNSFLNKVSKIDGLVEKHGRKGLKILFMFRFLKSQLIDEIQKKQGNGVEINENELNELCINKAKQIVERGKNQATEEDFKELLKEILLHD